MQKTCSSRQETTATGVNPNLCYYLGFDTAQLDYDGWGRALASDLVFMKWFLRITSGEFSNFTFAMMERDPRLLVHLTSPSTAGAIAVTETSGERHGDGDGTKTKTARRHRQH